MISNIFLNNCDNYINNNTNDDDDISNSDISDDFFNYETNDVNNSEYDIITNIEKINEFNDDVDYNVNYFANRKKLKASYFYEQEKSHDNIPSSLEFVDTTNCHNDIGSCNGNFLHDLFLETSKPNTNTHNKNNTKMNKLHEDFFVYASKHHNLLFHEILNKIINND